MLSANFRNTPVEEVHLPSQPGRHSLSNYPSAIQDHTTIQRGTSANAPHLEVCEQQRHYQQAEDHASLVGQQRRRSSTLTPKTAECFAAQNAAGSARDHVRRRITRACDQCNQLRTKCDGKHPCGHCLESGVRCEYVRQQKKRGKVSRKDTLRRRCAVAAPVGADVRASQESSDTGNDTLMEERSPIQQVEGDTGLKAWNVPGELPPSTLNTASSTHGNQCSTRSDKHNEAALAATSMDIARYEDPRAEASAHTEYYRSNGLSLDGGPVSAQSTASEAPMTHYFPADDRVEASRGRSMSFNKQHQRPSVPTTLAHLGISETNPQSYADYSYNFFHPLHRAQPSKALQLETGSSPNLSYLMSPLLHKALDLHSRPSVQPDFYGHDASLTLASRQKLRYPVLQPLMPYLGSVIPTTLACDLLDIYFQSSSSTFLQPASPYVQGYAFRKWSLLRQTNPRRCSPALLASMLFIGAQTSESALLTSPPSARRRICQKLFEITVSLLRPLIHGNSEATRSLTTNYSDSDATLGRFGNEPADGGPAADAVTPGTTAALDDVAAYMHLATVVSATEYKAASLRWWTAAWSLARELQLGVELPRSAFDSSAQKSTAGNRRNPQMQLDGGDRVPQDLELSATLQDDLGTITEEEREERRRVWWLLYTMDRHLSLCYNKPLFLEDVECEGLLQPVDDSLWQAGEFYDACPPSNHGDCGPGYLRKTGPSIECSGHSIFGYFTPLMTILGDIVDLNRARHHPRFAIRSSSTLSWDGRATEIVMQLEAYGRSLRDLEGCSVGNHMEPTMNDSYAELPASLTHAASSTASRTTEVALRTKMVVAYGTHLMHALHILLNGKWDPISLLDDNDSWISSESFLVATGHAVSAAEALGDVLEHDPDASFMPFFFGIYLLQGSFLLLLIADKLQGDASPSVIKACETIVRAHEACVVTLNTEYQRNFRKVMRSALAQVRGRWLEDVGEEQSRRRKVLSLYRWTAQGTGLAL